MKFAVTAVVAVLATLLVGYVQNVGAATPPAMSTYDAAQRLEIGRFAARNAIGHAICIGIGRNYPVRFDAKRYHVHDCKVTDKNCDNERQLTMTITGPTTFAVKWLTQMEVCAPPQP
jgi:hypothetical protein